MGVQEFSSLRSGGLSDPLAMPLAEQTAKASTLILISHRARQSRRDFEEIRAKSHAWAPEIDVHIVDAGQSADELDDGTWQRPCLVVSFGPLTFRPRRGLTYCCWPISK